MIKALEIISKKLTFLSILIFLYQIDPYYAVSLVWFFFCMYVTGYFLYVEKNTDNNHESSENQIKEEH